MEPRAGNEKSGGGTDQHWFLYIIVLHTRTDVQYSTNKFSLFKTKMNTATYSIQYILNNDFKLILLKFLKHVSGM